MLNRLILNNLNEWSERSDRKPLILRGARQVGKTTLVSIFAKKFKYYIYLNLENEADKSLFKNTITLDELTESIFYFKNKPLKLSETLLFIDEIQNSPEAIKRLRYFYEEKPELRIIGAGSLLETQINQSFSFPVGRVEYMLVRPLSFVEFLQAIAENQSVDMLNRFPVPEYAHDNLIKHFKTYSLLGGMPEVINKYLENRDILAANKVFESLILSYQEDVEKYANKSSLRTIIQYIISNVFRYASARIRYEGFANSTYKSREMSEAFQILEKTMLINLLRPSISVNLPIEPDHKKAPRLQLLDTGLVNYFAGIQAAFFENETIDNVFEGRISEHITCQEILAYSSSILYKPSFWAKDKSEANAEIDFIYPFMSLVIPIEVKSGSSGRLRSLFEFMDRAPHQFAVRIYSGKFSIDKITTIKGKEFFLMNLPFYLISKLEKYLHYLIYQYNK